jgi:DNA polymerase-3 subunit epsilon
MNFLAIDVETANADLASICQIGIAEFRDGKYFAGWKSYVDPEDEFDAINVSIHGIDEDMVAGHPSWVQLIDSIQNRIKDQILVSHTAFDRLSIQRATSGCAVNLESLRWLDSARIVRRAWPAFAKSGFGLGSVSKHLSITYQAHDALEDARCAGEILLRAIAHTGLSVEQWFLRVEQPIDPESAKPIKRSGNPDGSLYGEVLVFTGSLIYPRRQAADLAATAGCEVSDGVTKHTTLLVVGDQDIRKLAGHEKSSKHLKAELLVQKGKPIRILRETDFLNLVN